MTFRPTTATNEAIAQRVHNVVRDDRRKTIKEIAAEVGISVGSVHDVLHKHLNMHYVSQKLVPKMLSAEQKETRMTLAGDMISIADEDGDFLNKIIAGDETWCYLYDPVPKRQSSEWKSKTSPRKQQFPRDTSKGKVMLEVFFDSQGLIHHEFIPEGRTVTKELYVEILRRFRDAVRRKRPEKYNITAFDHPPYSPDLSPPDYFLFLRLKSHLKGRRFNAEELQKLQMIQANLDAHGPWDVTRLSRKHILPENEHFSSDAELHTSAANHCIDSENSVKNHDVKFKSSFMNITNTDDSTVCFNHDTEYEVYSLNTKVGTEATSPDNIQSEVSRLANIEMEATCIGSNDSCATSADGIQFEITYLENVKQFDSSYSDNYQPKVICIDDTNLEGASLNNIEYQTISSDNIKHQEISTDNIEPQVISTVNIESQAAPLDNIESQETTLDNIDPQGTSTDNTDSQVTSTDNIESQVASSLDNIEPQAPPFKNVKYWVTSLDNIEFQAIASDNIEPWVTPLHNVELKATLSENIGSRITPLDNIESQVDKIEPEETSVDNIEHQATSVDNIQAQATSLGNTEYQPTTLGNIEPQEIFLGNIDLQETFLSNIGSQATSLNNIEPQPTSADNIGPQATSLDNIEPQPTSVDNIDTQATSLDNIDPQATSLDNIEVQKISVDNIEYQETLLDHIETQAASTDNIESLSIFSDDIFGHETTILSTSRNIEIEANSINENIEPEAHSLSNDAICCAKPDIAEHLIKSDTTQNDELQSKIIQKNLFVVSKAIPLGYCVEVGNIVNHSESDDTFVQEGQDDPCDDTGIGHDTWMDKEMDHDNIKKSTVTNIQPCETMQDNNFDHCGSAECQVKDSSVTSTNISGGMRILEKKFDITLKRSVFQGSPTKDVSTEESPKKDKKKKKGLRTPSFLKKKKEKKKIAEA
ncbi:hypothetical protein ANN_02945 [Periplaneta americana]|uniref:Uncharacterized protein n=1 Tax=Periplaneta americana TaxID=6978 RepID=A0ABQ8TXP9_PERAM|nr:hypothetical protein ANN_02945 [Periplaneta americana]